MSSSNSSASVSFPFPIAGLAFLVLLVFKVGPWETAVQDWSWWWVTAPLWGSAIIGVVFFIIAGIALIIASRND